tara:strand:- start:227 stop:475 length:249 start_codon:yes stop_codon:yes gene_type:complete
MSERIKKAIEKVIYWKGVYAHCRKRLDVTCLLKYERKMQLAKTHLLSSLEWLKCVYEEEEKKKVVTIGNLPEAEVLAERLDA